MSPPAACRILHITRERGSDARYGIRKSLLPVVAALRERGHTVEIHDGHTSDEYLREHPLPGHLQHLWRLASRYTRWREGPGPALDSILAMLEERLYIAWTATERAARESYTHLHYHDPLLAWLGHQLNRLHPTRPARTPPWGYTSHAFGMFVQPRLGIDIPPRLQHRLQQWERKAAARADWLCAPTKTGLWQLQQELRYPQPSPAKLPENWHITPHPRPEYTALEPHQRQALRETARQQLHLPPDALLILAVGQLIPLKRHDWLINILARQKNIQAHLLLLGEGPLAEALHQQAAQRGLADRYHQFPCDDIRPWLAAADLYASASSTESWGMANCEALRAGLPAICAKVGPLEEVLGQGACLVENTPEALETALTQLLENPEQRQKQTEKARQQTQNWKTADQIADQMQNIYTAAPSPP